MPGLPPSPLLRPAQIAYSAGCAVLCRRTARLSSQKLKGGHKRSPLPTLNKPGERHHPQGRHHRHVESGNSGATASYPGRQGPKALGLGCVLDSGTCISRSRPGSYSMKLYVSLEHVPVHLPTSRSNPKTSSCSETHMRRTSSSSLQTLARYTPLAPAVMHTPSEADTR